MQAVHCILMHNLSREVSTLSVQHRAAYLRHSDTLQSAISFRDGELRHTEAAHDKLGQRPFFSGPATWNFLPADLRTVSDTTNFKNKLKTYLLKSTFDVQYINILIPFYLTFTVYLIVYLYLCVLAYLDSPTFLQLLRNTWFVNVMMMMI